MPEAIEKTVYLMAIPRTYPNPDTQSMFDFEWQDNTYHWRVGSFVHHEEILSFTPSSNDAGLIPIAIDALEEARKKSQEQAARIEAGIDETIRSLKQLPFEGSFEVEP